MDEENNHNSRLSISIHNSISSLLPSIQLGIFSSKVDVTESGLNIINKVNEITGQFHAGSKLDDISSIPMIAESKSAYRILGKDPSRYRPSAEALCRRIANGKPLYKINNIVDILNLISIQSGFSIGGYDEDKIIGNITLAKGKASDDYIAIGRGNLNIENLPVLYDDAGPFGSPTSDSIRTMISKDTKKFLMVIFDFYGRGNLNEINKICRAYYSEFTETKNMVFTIIKSS